MLSMSLTKTGSPHTPVAQSHYHLSLQQGQRQSTPHTLDAQTNHALSALNAPSALNEDGGLHTPQARRPTAIAAATGCNYTSHTPSAQINHALNVPNKDGVSTHLRRAD